GRPSGISRLARRSPTCWRAKEMSGLSAKLTTTLARPKGGTERTSSRCGSPPRRGSTGKGRGRPTPSTAQTPARGLRLTSGARGVREGVDVQGFDRVEAPADKDDRRQQDQEAVFQRPLDQVIEHQSDSPSTLVGVLPEEELGPQHVAAVGGHDFTGPDAVGDL